MTKLYKDYFWKNGVPFGTGFVEGSVGYKIVSDPYHKWISIEQYNGSKPDVIYDSRLLDFRKLHLSEQVGWEKVVIKETPEKIETMLRNQDDRVVFIEVAHFQGNRCKESKTYSSHNILLSVNQMFYEEWGDPFNGVILFDANHHPVMKKEYVCENGQFTELEEESWAISALLNKSFEKIRAKATHL